VRSAWACRSSRSPQCRTLLSLHGNFCRGDIDPHFGVPSRSIIGISFHSADWDLFEAGSVRIQASCFATINSCSSFSRCRQFGSRALGLLPRLRFNLRASSGYTDNQQQRPATPTTASRELQWEVLAGSFGRCAGLASARVCASSLAGISEGSVVARGMRAG